MDILILDYEILSVFTGRNPNLIPILRSINCGLDGLEIVRDVDDFGDKVCIH
jgi:hypothetical protein